MSFIGHTTDSLWSVRRAGNVAIAALAPVGNDGNDDPDCAPGGREQYLRPRLRMERDVLK